MRFAAQGNLLVFQTTASFLFHHRGFSAPLSGCLGLIELSLGPISFFLLVCLSPLLPLRNTLRKMPQYNNSLRADASIRCFSTPGSPRLRRPPRQVRTNDGTGRSHLSHAGRYKCLQRLVPVGLQHHRRADERARQDIMHHGAFVHSARCPRGVVMRTVRMPRWPLRLLTRLPPPPPLPFNVTSICSLQQRYFLTLTPSFLVRYCCTLGCNGVLSDAAAAAAAAGGGRTRTVLLGEAALQEGYPQEREDRRPQERANSFSLRCFSPSDYC